MMPPTTSKEPIAVRMISLRREERPSLGAWEERASFLASECFTENMLFVTGVTAKFACV